jgi:hypothetical protein
MIRESKYLFFFCVLGIVLGGAAASISAEVNNSRSVVVEDCRNEHATFSVRVDVDHPDRVYESGETMQVRVQSEKSGYLYLFYLSADNKLHCLFPNNVQTDNEISANQQIVVPSAQAQFKLRVQPPLGAEILKAIVTLDPVKPQDLGVKSLTKSAATPLSFSALKDVAVELQRRQTIWAEHQVEITTVREKVSQTQRRLGLFIGISKYQDSRIPSLSICDQDAATMAEMMKRFGKLDDATILTNQNATLSNIKKAICTKLVADSRPGDTVFIFWSGHGARCASTDSRESDGFDEFLVPYDGAVDDIASIRRTMLLDDTLGRWAQDLDGRKLIFIFDACHSAGVVEGQKSLGFFDSTTGISDRFLIRKLARTKDLGQKEMAVLASSTAKQISVERREGDLSVMTYYLVELLNQARGGVSIVDGYKYVEEKVPAYIKEKFPGLTQTPVFVDYTTPPVYLRQ